jgi:hypothetical protein
MEAGLTSGAWGGLRCAGATQRADLPTSRYFPHLVANFDSAMRRFESSPSRPTHFTAIAASGKIPDSFDPDRFAVDQTKTRPRYAHLPFGAGPRICIGASFAMIEATVALAVLGHAFRFTAVIGHRPHPVARVTLRPRGGMPLYIEPR